MKKKGFIINVFTMTASMLIIRLAAMASNIYISAKAGAEAMGLYHIIFSVYSFAVTVSVSGSGLAATRLISEQNGKTKKCGENSIIKKCLLLTLTASSFACAMLFFGAKTISEIFMPDKRCIPALKLLAPSLIPLGASSVIRGCIIAKRRAALLTMSQITEEITSIAITVMALKKYSGTPYAYMCMIIGCTVSEFVAFAFDFVLLKLIFKNGSAVRKSVRMREILNICVPVALGSYLRSGLVALENVMIPQMLTKSGIEEPLAEYGLIRAMAMQILLFPTVFIHSFASMLVPEMSEMNAAMRKNGIRYVASLAIKCTLIFAFAAASLIFKFHDELAVSFYKNEKAGIYLGMLSLLSIPMYLDTVVDSMLKGLNQQMSNLKFNIADSALRVVAIRLFLPKYGIIAYITLLYVSEIFNLSLSLGKLIAVSGLKINLTQSIIFPTLCSIASIIVSTIIKINGLFAQIIIFCAIYILSSLVLQKSNTPQMRIFSVNLLS